MTLLVSICIGVIFAVSFYLLMGKELKEVAMGVFLIGHAANLGILAMSGQPLMVVGSLVEPKGPPILGTGRPMVDPLPQALILTAIVIGFAVVAFLLTLLVATYRRTHELWIDDLAAEGNPAFLIDGATERKNAAA
ncbi:MAG: NADH-quinone oxidoreductase subunit K [Phycisphaeraceae bacterium]|nr:NADH-quinone oxidoreductase subunit K [Phycisphaeraceae bacterium]